MSSENNANVAPKSPYSPLVKTLKDNQATLRRRAEAAGGVAVELGLEIRSLKEDQRYALELADELERVIQAELASTPELPAVPL